MKKLISIALALLMIGSMAACGTSATPATEDKTPAVENTEPIGTTNEQDRVEIIFAHVHQPDAESSEIHSQALYIQDAVRDAGIDIVIYAASELGGQSEINEAMRLGTIGMSICGTSTFSPVAPTLAICDFPYLWKNFDHISEVMDGEIGESLKPAMDGTGLKILNFSRSWGFRNVGLCEKKATNYDEFANLKIRTIQSEISIGCMTAMNTAPTPMAMGEVYTSLQTGVLDGFEHTAATTMMNKWNEVCKYFVLTEHQEPELCTVISEVVWDSLSPEQQEALQKACYEAGLDCSNKALEKDAYYKEQLAASGTEIIEIDKTEFIKHANDFNESYAEKIGVTDLYNQIVALGEKYD